jgi:hypothetical protein
VASVAAVEGDDQNNDDPCDGGEAPANEVHGGNVGYFSIIGFSGVFSHFGFDPADNDEGRQLSAASRRARRRAGNRKREAKRARRTATTTLSNFWSLRSAAPQGLNTTSA